MPDEPGSAEVDVSGEATRAGFVALVGRPNVGKSSLLNALLGEKLSIVTARAQTTRERVTGILTLPAAQLVFLDTPGLLEPSYLLQRSMLEQALRALDDADVTLLLLDGTDPAALPQAAVVARLREADEVRIVVNKLDAASSAALEALRDWAAAQLPGAPVHTVSARTGAGVEALLQDVSQALPPSPFLYPADDIAVQSVRFFVAELVRETLFDALREEVPYSTAVQVDEFREADEPLYIRATIYVERDSQKSIVIGKGGQSIREIGAASRGKIESFLQRRVYLDLWVKTKPGWRRKKSGLQQLGYTTPENP